jgi:tight adherence protein B
MMWVSAVAVFAGLFGLLYFCVPGRHVSKRRLGVERERTNLGRSMEHALGDDRQRRLAKSLSLAGVSTPPGTFVLRVLVGSVLLAIACLLVSPILALAALALPYAVARSWVSHKVGKRQERFAAQLPDFLRSLVMSLRSGFGLTQAIEMAVSEASEPIRDEIERVLAEVRMGRSLPEAMRGLADRMENSDLEWVIGAMEINRETGGNLSEVLATVNATIRERWRLQRRVRSFTAEGLFSAKILTAAPFLFALWQWRAHPEGFDFLFQGAGLLVLVGCTALMALGWFWIKRVVTIKI